MFETPDMSFKVLNLFVLHIAVLYKKKMILKKAIKKFLKVSKKKNPKVAEEKKKHWLNDMQIHIINYKSTYKN